VHAVENIDIVKELKKPTSGSNDFDVSTSKFSLK
jgi:hypothetical protein